MYVCIHIYIYNSKVLNKNLQQKGMITCIKDCYCYNYDIKMTSGNNDSNRHNIGKELNETKLLIKTMKRIRHERHDKENKNDNSYPITNLNKTYPEI